MNTTGQKEPSYFSDSELGKNAVWGTTVSATAECAYDPDSTDDMGRLLSVPNYDRNIHRATGEIVYTQKIAGDNLQLIKRGLDFEAGYQNDQKYCMLPGLNAGFNSNSFFRGVIEYMEIGKEVEIPSCFKAPGYSKVLEI